MGYILAMLIIEAIGLGTDRPDNILEFMLIDAKEATIWNLQIEDKRYHCHYQGIRSKQAQLE